MPVRIVDTTLRDGEQKAGIALGIKEKLEIAGLLDKTGIYQIEAGIPAMGGHEKKSIYKIRSMGLKSKISGWNRMNLSDVKHSIDCGVEIIHISVPVSDIQIKSKLGRDRIWVTDNMKKCISFAREKGFEVTVGLEDASRADLGYIVELIAAAHLEGASRIRYADTVGIMLRRSVYETIYFLKQYCQMPLEMHAHNDLGMAVANSIAAAEAGAEFVDCTIGGIGERAGNCDFCQFINAAGAYLGLFEDTNKEEITNLQKEVMCIITKK
ncbi:MAG: homocitrate synthase [Clostridia bacterium]|nr:homocitrate synthase [Clostridia bacterium]